ncbi:uncharacterized protein [Ptychodera flava]|uniref:uncharacterized protein n=1 Tax=Ptychodera flava TaxID=63121 RepID=UPI00396A1927
MTEDIKNDMHHYGSITLVSLPIPSEDVNISKEPSLIYYVILIEYDQSSKRRRKRYTGTSGLGAYNETGPPYYITALLPLYGLPQKFIIGDGGIYGGYTNVPLTLGRQYSVYYGLKSEINGEPFYYFDEQPSIVFTAVVKGNVCHSWSTVTIIVSVIALVLILCLITVLVYTIRRQNPRKRRNEHEEVRLGKTNTKPPRKDNKEEKQDKPKEGFPDGNYQYAYENVSTQQSTDLTTTPRYQNRQNDNEERLYTGLVKELGCNVRVNQSEVVNVSDSSLTTFLMVIVPVKKVWRYIHNLGEKRFKNLKAHYKTHGVVPRDHGRRGKRPVNAYSFEVVQDVVKFLLRYADDNGLPMPAAPHGRDGRPPVYLPSCDTKADVYKKYVNACKVCQPAKQSVGETTFRNIWKLCVPHIQRMEPNAPTHFRNEIQLTTTEEDKLNSSIAFSGHILKAQRKENF